MDMFRKHRILFLHFHSYSHSETLNRKCLDLSVDIEGSFQFTISFRVDFVRLQSVIRSSHVLNIREVVFIESDVERSSPIVL